MCFVDCRKVKIDRVERWGRGVWIINDFCFKTRQSFDSRENRRGLQPTENISELINTSETHHNSSVFQQSNRSQIHSENCQSYRVGKKVRNVLNATNFPFIKSFQNELRKLLLPRELPAFLCFGKLHWRAFGNVLPASLHSVQPTKVLLQAMFPGSLSWAMLLASLRNFLLWAVLWDFLLRAILWSVFKPNRKVEASCELSSASEQRIPNQSWKLQANHQMQMSHSCGSTVLQNNLHEVLQSSLPHAYLLVKPSKFNKVSSR